MGFSSGHLQGRYFEPTTFRFQVPVASGDSLAELFQGAEATGLELLDLRVCGDVAVHVRIRLSDDSGYLEGELCAAELLHRGDAWSCESFVHLAAPGQPGLLSCSRPVAPFVRLALRRSQQVAPLDALPFWLESTEGEASGVTPVPGDLRLCVKRLRAMPGAELKALARAKELGLKGAHSWRLHVMTGTEVLSAEGADEIWDLVGSSCSGVQLELCLALDGAELSMFSSYLSCEELWAFRDSDAVLASVTLGPWAKLEVEILAPSQEKVGEASPSSVQSARLPRSTEPLVTSPLPQPSKHSVKMVSPLSCPESPLASSLASVARSPSPKLEVEILPQPSPEPVSEVSSPFKKPLGPLPPLPVRTELSPKMDSPKSRSEPSLASLELVMATHLPDLSQLAMPESVEIMLDLGPDEFISMREVARQEIGELEKLQEQLLAFGVKRDVPEVREVAEMRGPGGKIEPILEVPQQPVKQLDLPDEPEPAAEESLGSEEKSEQTHVVREKAKPPGNGSGAPPPKVVKEVEEVEPAPAPPASPQPCQLDGRGPLPLDLLPKPSLASSPKPPAAASTADASPPSPTPSAPDPDQLPMVFERPPSPARSTTRAPATPAPAARTPATPAPATPTPAPTPATPAPATPEPSTPVVMPWSIQTLPERPRWAVSPSWLSERWAPSELKSTGSTRATLRPLTWSDRIDVNTKRLARIMRGAPRGESSDSD